MPNEAIQSDTEREALGSLLKFPLKGETPVYRLLRAQHMFTGSIQSRRKDNDNSISMSYCRTFGVVPCNSEMPSAINVQLKSTGAFSLNGAINKCQNPSCIACSIERAKQEYEDLSLVMDNLVGTKGYSCLFLTTTHSTLKDNQANYSIQSKVISRISDAIKNYHASNHSSHSDNKILYRSIIETTFSKDYRVIDGERLLTQHSHCHTLLFIPPEHLSGIEFVLNSIRKSYKRLLTRSGTHSILDDGDESKGFYIRRYGALTDDLRNNLSRYVSGKMSLSNKLSMENSHSHLKTGKGYNLYELLDHCWKTKDPDYIAQYQNYIKTRTGKHAFRASKELKRLITDLNEMKIDDEECTSKDVKKEIKIHPSLWNTICNTPNCNSYMLKELLYYKLRHSEYLPELEQFITEENCLLYQFDFVHYSIQSKSINEKSKLLSKRCIDLLQNVDYDMVRKGNTDFINSGMYHNQNRNTK